MNRPKIEHGISGLGGGIVVFILCSLFFDISLSLVTGCITGFFSFVSFYFNEEKKWWISCPTAFLAVAGPVIIFYILGVVNYLISGIILGLVALLLAYLNIKY